MITLEGRFLVDLWWASGESELLIISLDPDKIVYFRHETTTTAIIKIQGEAWSFKANINPNDLKTLINDVHEL